jgi:hypothetical protein
MARFSLGMFLALYSHDVSGAAQSCLSKAERTRQWAAERAAIKAKVKRAKETVDLLRMAQAIIRLDALEASQKSEELSNARFNTYASRGTTVRAWTPGISATWWRGIKIVWTRAMLRG